MKENNRNMVFEDKAEKEKEVPFDRKEEAKPDRSKLLKWFLKILDFIATLFT